MVAGVRHRRGAPPAKDPRAQNDAPISARKTKQPRTLRLPFPAAAESPPRAHHRQTQQRPAFERAQPTSANAAMAKNGGRKAATRERRIPWPNWPNAAAKVMTETAATARAKVLRSSAGRLRMFATSQRQNHDHRENPATRWQPLTPTALLRTRPFSPPALPAGNRLLADLFVFASHPFAGSSLLASENHPTR
jgi:hypothetical protein